MDMNKEDAREKPRTLPVLLIAAIIILLTGAVCSAMFIIKNYQRLGEELKLERTVYVNEISGQISSAVYQRRDRLLDQIAGSASALDYAGASSFGDVQRLFKDKLDEEYHIVLCDDQGKCFDVYGAPFPIQNNARLSQSLEAGGPEYFFEKGSSGIDYWVFASQIEPKQIKGHTFIVILEIYEVEQFQSDLSLDLFEDEGGALIVNCDGTVNLRPVNSGLNIGYNAIRTFEEWGMPEEQAEGIKRDLVQHGDGRLYVDFLDTDWLVDYNNIKGSDEYVMVLVPIAVTSAGVVESLRDSTIGVVGLITCIAVLVLVFILRGTRQAKIRNKQLYDLRLRAKVVESKNDFLAKMSHDIRTPLNAIIGMNYIAATQVEEGAPVMDSLRKIGTSANYLLGILNDILDMSKIESGRMEIHHAEFSLSELLASLDSILDVQAKEKRLSFVLKADPYLRPCYIGDKLRINQILMNLTSNALKFTPAGGHITVEVELAGRDGDEDTVRFVVSDDGIGMSEEFLRHIFEPFTQDGSGIANQYGGSGLGLAIVKSLTEQMNGQVSVRSRKDLGSAFTVTLPLRAAQKASGAGLEEAELDEGRLAGMKILLAEDNELNRMIAKEILQMRQIEVDETEDGQAALDQFLQKPAGYYAAIITDIRMPVMDGYELADRVRGADHPDAAEIPILAMSANAFDDDVAASAAHGMNAHLKKPIDVDELVKALCTYARSGGEAGTDE